MDSSEFDALVTSLKKGNYLAARSLFFQCKMIWPNKLPELADAINVSKVRENDTYLYRQLTTFVEIYADALNGKLQLNDYYLACFKPKPHTYDFNK